MSDNNEQTAEGAAAFQRIWTESMSKLMQTAFASGGSSPPPEMLRQIRGAIFEALAQSWDEFMRSPQFLDSMKQWMDNAVTFRKMTNDFMGRVRNEMQVPSRDDIDSVMLSVRHMETRILARLDGLSAEVSALSGRAASPNGRKPSVKGAGRAAKSTAAPGKPTSGKGRRKAT
jgi:hypothetical protein